MSLVEHALAERVLTRALARGGDFAELYAEARSGFAISLDDGRVERPQGGRERGACVRVVAGESTYYGHVDGLAEAAVQRWGGIDGWVNNAAQILVRPFLELTDDDWRDLLEVNLLGYVRGARAAARVMVPAGAGAIVNVGSVGQPRDGDPRASCVIVEDRLIRFLRTDYDIATCQRKIYDNPNIPDLCAARLEIGK